MNNLEAFMAGVTVGVFTGIFLAYWGNRWQNHDTRLEVRTRGDEHAEGLE